MPSAGPPVSCRVAAAAALSIAPPASTPALRSCSAPSRPSGRGVPSGVGRAAMRSHARIRLSGHETPNTKRSFTQTTTEDVPGRPVGTASRRRGSLRPTPRAVPARPSLPTCRRCLRRATARGSVRRGRAPGGGTDTLARIVAQHLQGALGQPVAVENRSGGSGVVGTEAVARAVPDGYTLAMTASGPITILPQMMPNPPYHPVRSFAHVALPSVTPLFMVVPPASPARDVGGFVAWA